MPQGPTTLFGIEYSDSITKGTEFRLIIWPRDVCVRISSVRIARESSSFVCVEGSAEQVFGEWTFNIDRGE